MVGIGGLGHMGIKLAHAMGAHVVAFTTSESKRADALALGAWAATGATKAAANAPAPAAAPAKAGGADPAKADGAAGSAEARK